MKIIKKTLGFTLIELLITIAVIGILASIVYANFGASRAGARDDVRKADLKSLQLALSLYKAQNGEYPTACDDAVGTWKGEVTGSFKCADGGPFIKGLTPDFIASVPKDPKNGTYGSNSNLGYIYYVTSDRKQYKIMAHGVVESKKITSYADEFARCDKSYGSAWCGGTSPQNNSYAVYVGTNAAAW